LANFASHPRTYLEHESVLQITLQSLQLDNVLHSVDTEVDVRTHDIELQQIKEEGKWLIHSDTVEPPAKKCGAMYRPYIP
jgi:hypothetical protein